MVNKFRGECDTCGGEVPAHGGLLFRGRSGAWRVRHLTCANGGHVNSYQIGGKTYTRNARGRCEDAPCCGCCTI